MTGPRDKLSQLAEQQGALRRVATLVARGVSPSEVFAAVADEMAHCLNVDNAGLFRYESGEAVLVAECAPVAAQWPVGDRRTLEGDNVPAMVLRTGRAARIDGFENAAGSIAARSRELGLRSAVAVPIVVDAGVWGGAYVASTAPEPLPADTEARMGEFAELVAMAIAAAIARADLQDSRDRLSELAEQQTALRRVATLVARGVSPSEVFAAVADEVCRCLNVQNVAVGRFEGDELAIVAVSRMEPGMNNPMVVGDRFAVEGDNIATRVLRTGRAARLDRSESLKASGPLAERMRENGRDCTVGVPIVVDGQMWGLAGVATATAELMPADIEVRLGDFAELVATAIANAAAKSELQTSRDRLHELAEQQAGLRRIATLVAQGVSPSEVFGAVADEVGRCLNIDNVALGRFDGDEVVVIALSRTEPGMTNPLVVGERSTLDGDNIASRVFGTGRTARLDLWGPERASGPVADRLRENGFSCIVGVPIVIDGRVWGAAGFGAPAPELMPAGIEVRLGDFVDLLATAIANAATHDELIASRARIVAAADDARRRLERDLHDGAQQRLVSLGVQLRLAEESVPPEQKSIKERLSRVVDGLTEVSKELQEISRGIHPAILSDGGLGPALKTLARRSPVAVNLDVAVKRRLPDPVEVAAYYVAAEALTNAAKYAQACEVNVCAAMKGEALYLSIQDDGIGGADSRKGSGLIGLKDRVEVLGGDLQIASPAGRGTTLHVTIPVTG